MPEDEVRIIVLYSILIENKQFLLVPEKYQESHQKFKCQSLIMINFQQDFFQSNPVEKSWKVLNFHPTFYCECPCVCNNNKPVMVPDYHF